ncbi:MAG: translational GTPase TypA [Patescibacteria group bacterium]
MEIRNIAIIAHVDHGKTTLTDALMKQTGMAAEGTTMDSNKLEQERGITIYAKNTSVNYKGTKINIVDTPGHADFGSEVERVLRSIDSVLLVVDAQEGPMPQTRFVLKKSLELGLKPIVVLNKIDKPAARLKESHDEILELFLELGANEDQLNFPMVYAIGREGVAMKNPTDEKVNLNPLLDMILEHVAPANKDEDKDLTAQAFNLGYDNFLGRLAIARIYAGKIKTNTDVFLKKHDGTTKKYRITKLFTFEGLTRKEVAEASSGDIVMIAGLTDVYIGDTISYSESAELMPSIHIDEPTIALDFLVNDSPFAGKEGKFVTGRQIRDRLEKELEINVGLKVDFASPERLKVYGRGELHIAILLENMRREGFEIQVSKPEVIIHEENGKKMEPYEEVTVDAPEVSSGTIIEKLGKRKGIMTNMKQDDKQVRMTFEIPTRGLLGYRNEFTIDTKGEGILSSRFTDFRAYAGEIEHRDTGAMISMETGKALAYSLWCLQDRGQLYIPAATDVYAGMVIGNTSKGEEMEVNPTKNKNLSNVRSSGNDEALYLVPPQTIDIEKGLEIMSDDEYMEITPKSVRLRKKFLSGSERAKGKKK